MERGVLGCMLLGPKDCVPVVEERLSPDAFYMLTNREVFIAMLEVGAEHLDVKSLNQKLKDKSMLAEIGGIPYLNQLADEVPSAANLTYYLEVVEQKFQLRRLLKIAGEIAERVYAHDGSTDHLLDEVERDILQISQNRSAKEAARMGDYVP